MRRLVGAVQASGPKAETEAEHVLEVARRHLDDRVIDEGIGVMCQLAQRAKRPVYLLEVLNDRAEELGIPELRLHPRAVPA